MEASNYRDIKEAFPDYHDWYFVSYKELIESMGLDILVQEDYGSYQGETLMFVKDTADTDRHGIINFTWGS